MAKKKIYAVRKGKLVGIFRSWDECRDSVNGYPGAEYKGFFYRGRSKRIFIWDREERVE